MKYRKTTGDLSNGKLYRHTALQADNCTDRQLYRQTVVQADSSTDKQLYMQHLYKQTAVHEDRCTSRQTAYTQTVVQADSYADMYIDALHDSTPVQGRYFSLINWMLTWTRRKEINLASMSQDN